MESRRLKRGVVLKKRFGVPRIFITLSLFWNQLANFYWSKGMTPFTEDMEAPLQSEGVSICFTNLYNMQACSGIDS
jgi:hypothetical protein